MSSRFTTIDPLTNVMLRDSSGVFSSPVQSRRDVALHNYTKGLIDSTGIVPDLYVLKSYNDYAPHIIEASAWIQHFHPDPYWHVPWKDEPGTFDMPPDCVDANIYYYIQNALHTNRKSFMQGKEHYYIRQLDFRVFELQTPGKDAANCLLAHISKVNPQVDKYAHFTVTHHGLPQGLGWEYVGPMAIDPVVAHDGKLLTFPPGTGSWVLRGVPDSDMTAAAAISKSSEPPKPGSAGLDQSLSGCVFI